MSNCMLVMEPLDCYLLAPGSLGSIFWGAHYCMPLLFATMYFLIQFMIKLLKVTSFMYVIFIQYSILYFRMRGQAENVPELLMYTVLYQET